MPRWFPILLALSACSCDEAIAGSRQAEEPGPSCVPIPERCNGRDDDCDGQVDEELAPLACGTGSCAREVPACTGGLPGECIAGDSSVERCNGLDDDCDGQVDEGLPVESCGIGACERTGSTCSPGGPCVPGLQSPELCANGIDDDCDGADDCFDRECFDPRTIAPLDLDSPGPPGLAERAGGIQTRGVPAPGGGYGVVYMAGGNAQLFGLRFARIDEQGIRLGPARPLDGSTGVSAFELLPAPDGFLVIAARVESGGGLVVDQRRLDVDGAELARSVLAPFDPAPPAGWLAAAALADGSGTLVAVAGVGPAGSGAAVVRLARIGASGELLAGWTELPGELEDVTWLIVRPDGAGASLLIENVAGPAGEFRHAAMHRIDPVSAQAGPAISLYDEPLGPDVPDFLPVGDGTYLVSRTLELAQERQVELSRRDASGAVLAVLGIPGADLLRSYGSRLAWRGDDVGVFFSGSWGGLAWTVVPPDLSRNAPAIRATTGGCPELGSILPGGTLPRAILAFNCLASEGAVAFFDASICPR